MPNFKETLFVRHGEYNRKPEVLTPRGKLQAEEAAAVIVARELGPRAVLLSSDAPRALETAGIIGRVSDTSVVASKRINILGNDPDGLKSTEDWEAMLHQALVESGAETEGDGLIIVAHQPLLEVVTGDKYVANGEVVSYDPTAWHNAYYKPEREESLVWILRYAGLADVELAQ